MLGNLMNLLKSKGVDTTAILQAVGKLKKIVNKQAKNQELIKIFSTVCNKWY